MHCDSLMMQQKEARRKHSCVLPKKVAFVVWVFDSALIGNDGCYLRASCMLPSILLLKEQAWHSRKHPSFPSKPNWTENHTIWSTFQGSTQEAHMGATCVLPSVASLTGRAVFFDIHTVLFFRMLQFKMFVSFMSYSKI